MNILKSFKAVLIALVLSAGAVAQAQIASPPNVVGDLSICLSGSAVLTANDPTGTAGTTFEWYQDPLLGPDVFLQESDSIVLGPLAVTTSYRVRTVDPITGDVSPYTDFTVTVNTLQTNVDVVAATPSPLTVCNGGSVTYTATATLGSPNFRWYDALVGGNLLFEGIGTNEYTTGPLTLAEDVYVSGVDVNGCESPRVLAVPPVVLPTLDVPIGVADPAIICSGDTTKLYTVNKPVGGTVRWYDAIVGGNLEATGDTFELDFENTGAANLGLTFFAEFEDVNGCRSLRTPVAIIVLPALDVPLVDNPIQTICTGESATFTASSLLANPTFKWYDELLGGNLLFTGATFNTGPINNAGATDLLRTYYVAVEDANGCESVRIPVTVTILPALDLPTVTPPAQTACPGDSVTFNATSLFGNATFRWYDDPLAGNLLHEGAEFNTGPLPNGGALQITEMFYVEVEDENGCVSLRAPASVVVLPAVALPVVDPPLATICSGDSVEFTATSIPEAEEFYWYDNLLDEDPIAQGVTFNTGAISNTGPVDLIRDYYVEAEDANGCRSIRVPVTVTILPALDVPLVTPLTDIICNGDSVEFTASSLLGAGITYRWYDSPTGGTLLNQGETFNTGPLTNGTGTNLTELFWVELEDQNGCKSLRTPAAVIIRPALDLPLANPPVNTICDGDSAVFVGSSLGNLLGQDVTFRWYDTLLAGTELAVGDTFTTPSISNGTGLDLTEIYYLEAEDTAGCRSLRTPATVVVRPALDVPVATPPVATICDGDSATFAGNSVGNLIGLDVTFNWYEDLLGGSPIFTGDTFTTPGISNGTGVDLTELYYLEAEDSLGCKSIRTPATVVVRPALDVPLATPPVQTVCEGDSAVFVGNSVGNLLGLDVTFNWYEDLLGGSPIFTGDTFTSPSLTNNTGLDLTEVYYLEAEDTVGCKSLRTPATTVIRPALDVPLVNPLVDVICTGDSAIFIANSVGNLLGLNVTFNWYEDLLGGTPIFTGDTFTTETIINNGAGDLTRIFYVEAVDANGCRSIRTPATVIIRPSANIPLVNPPLSFVCEGDSARLTATSLIDAEYKWYNAPVDGDLLFEGDTFVSGPLTNASGLDLDTLFYVEAVDTAGCISPVRNFGTVIIRPALDVPVVSPLVDSVCSGGEVEFVASSLLGNAFNFYWYEDLLGGSPVFVGDTFRTEVSSNGSLVDITKIFYVEVEDSSGCRSARVPATVIITPGLIPPTVDPVLQRICSGNTATIVASPTLGTGVEFRWYTNLIGGSPIFVGDTLITDTLVNNGLADLAQTFYVEQRDSATGGCASVRIPATVIVTRSPDNPTIENPNNVVCDGEQVTFVASAPDSVPGTISWYETVNSTSPIFVGDTFVTDPLSASGAIPETFDFFAEFTDTTGCVSTRTRGTATVRPLLDLPSADPSNQTICSGGDAQAVGNSANASVETFRWFDQASGGTPIFEGDTLVLENLQNNSAFTQTRTYYVSSVDSAGCVSPRASFFVNVQPATQRPTVDPPAPSICTGSSATLMANSALGDTGTYHWFAEIGDSEPIFVGRTYTTEVFYNFDDQLTQEDFFVQVEDTAGCASNLREVVVTVVTNGDEVAAIFENSPVCHGDPAVLSGVSANGFDSFKWYRGATDITPFFEGDTLVTVPLFSDTVVFLSSFNGDCSSKRTPIAIETLEVLEIGRPVVQCGNNSSAEEVSFTWQAVDNATGYEVSTDGGITWKAPSDPANLSHTEMKQSEDQLAVRLIVRGTQTPTACSEEFGPASQEVACFFDQEISDEVFNSFSPNGDGINDFWTVTDGIELYPDNEVQVFNRWGEEVFKTQGYDNDNNVFRGDDLEDGAYFYVVTIPSIDFEKTGYVMIIR